MKRYLYSVLVLGLAACAHKEPTADSFSGNKNAGVQEIIRSPAESAQGTDVYLMSEDGRSAVNFERCKGVAKLVRNGSALVLKIEDSDCANIVTEIGTWKLNGEGNEHRNLDIVLNEDTNKRLKVAIASNSYIKSNGKQGNADFFFINIKSKTQLRTLTVNSRIELEEDALENCDGVVGAKRYGKEVYVMFRSVKKCNRFDFIVNNGVYSWQSAPGLGLIPGPDGLVGNSQMPLEFSSNGNNSAIVRIYSEDGRIEDKVKIQF